MKVVVAPDAFGGTLTAPEAVRAIVEGWQLHAPGDEMIVAPMADGGPGFVDVLHLVLGGDLNVTSVHGPYGDEVPAAWLHVGHVAYIECAQACGLHLTTRRDPMNASTVGVGELLLAALDAGARRVVVGLGGSATNDGGAGLLHALGATADRPLDHGPDALDGVTSVDLSAARARFNDVHLVIASDVTTTLLGMFGASKTFGPQKGLTDEQIMRVDAILDRFVDAACGSVPSQRAIADAAGSGAAGGLGFALLALDGTVRSGIELVADAVNLSQAAEQADLVVTGEGRYDFSSRSGKVVYGVAQVAAEAARPCIVLAGDVDVGSREMRAMGVESGYSMTDLVGPHAAMNDPYRSLVRLAERVARTWSRGSRP